MAWGGLIIEGSRKGKKGPGESCSRKSYHLWEETKNRLHFCQQGGWQNAPLGVATADADADAQLVGHLAAKTLPNKTHCFPLLQIGRWTIIATLSQ